MSTQEDIDAFKIVDVSATEYSYWVEEKILTQGKDRLVENVLGLVGEAGEVAEKVKKMVRDNKSINQKDIVKELGDVLFYTVALANIFGGPLLPDGAFLVYPASFELRLQWFLGLGRLTKM